MTEACEMIELATGADLKSLRADAEKLRVPQRFARGPNGRVVEIGRQIEI